MSLMNAIPGMTLMTLYTSFLLIALIPKKELILPFKGYYSMHELVSAGKFLEISQSPTDTFAVESNSLGLEPNLTEDALIVRNIPKIMETIRSSSESYFYVDDPYMIHHWTKTFCELSDVIDEEGPIKLMGLAFQKNSGLARRFDEIIPEKRELYELIYDRYEAYGKEECVFEAPQQLPFKVKNIREAIGIYIVGTSIGILVFFVEMFLKICGFLYRSFPNKRPGRLFGK